MTATTPNRTSALRAIAGIALLGAVAVAVFLQLRSEPSEAGTSDAREPRKITYRPRQPFDTSGFQLVVGNGEMWRPESTLAEIAAVWDRRGAKLLEQIESSTSDQDPLETALGNAIARTLVLLYEGRPADAYRVATEARARAEGDPIAAEDRLYTFIYLQGLASLRRGEDENCIMCRGESSCILPISKAAIHANADGSRLAIRHFSEYLDEFPDDLQARWCLNLAHMTLGEHPVGVDPKRLMRLDAYDQPEHGIGRFRDVGHLVGINRFNQAGGAILEDFDNDGWLDLVVTTMDPLVPMAFHRNTGNGTFEDRTESAGVRNQLGGLNCVQADFDNDGLADVFIIRGAWQSVPMRPTLLRNTGNGTFADVTMAAGVGKPVNSIAACWADYDNDGFLDLFVCCESSANLLYRNLGNGSFEEVAGRAGLAGEPGLVCKGANWIDFDNDDYPDLFLNHLNDGGRLFRNNRNGTFIDASRSLGIAGPAQGFSCWAWDYDNDGWLDIFATSYERPPSEVLASLTGGTTALRGSALFRNREGKGFVDVAPALGLNKPFVAMGSNFADLDNDGWLDCYLGTGDPNIDMLVPNRMLRNLGGQRFADISACSGTAHLQKGHGVAIGDWNRDGTNDIFIEMGGAIPGDRYHNVLFQNPGNANRWINLKLEGRKTNRSAIGARVKIVTAGPNPRTIHRHVSTGSSFGANPLEQLIGIGTADRIATLEVHWPTSGTTQVFRDVKANQALRIVELVDTLEPREYRPIPLPAKN